LGAFLVLLKLATCAPPQTRMRGAKKTCFLFCLLFVALGQGIFNSILAVRCTPLHFFSISRSKGKMILGYTRGVLRLYDV
jgi:hypothetical protein